MKKHFTEENYMSIYQVVSIFDNLYGEEVRKINRGNYVKENPMVVKMVDFAQAYFPILQHRTQDSIGIQISICVESCYKDRTNWGEQHLKYKQIYRKIHDSNEDLKKSVIKLHKSRC